MTPTPKHTVTLDGVRYESQADLARAKGLDVRHVNAKIRKARKQGRKAVTLACGVVILEGEDGRD